MTFLQNYQSFLDKFNPHLNNYLSSLPDIVAKMDKSALSLIEIVSLSASSNGKRLRPYLVCLGYQIASNKSFDSKTVLNASMVSEIFHSFALIHDDIIDRSDTRRNQKTSHILFEDIHKNQKLKNDPSHFGTSMAILAGDLQIALSSQIIADLEVDSKIKQNLLDSFNEMFINLVLGEYQDVYQSFSPIRPSEEMIMSTLRWKSGEYTIEFPLKFGALLGGADKKLLDFFSQFAVPVGIAFQLKDDLLGVFSDSEAVGKSNLSDIREGKNTLLIKYALSRANDFQKNQLEQILGDSKADTNDLAKVQDILTSTGAKSAIEQKIKDMTKSARDLIDGSGISADYSQILSEFTDYITNREK